MWDNTKYFSTETRKILKEKFPAVKFSVRCERDRIDINYSDKALTESEVHDAIKHFDLDEFDFYSDYWKTGQYEDPVTGVKYYCCSYFIGNHNPEYIESVRAEKEKYRLERGYSQ